jgi:hypothetical protein
MNERFVVLAFYMALTIGSLSGCTDTQPGTEEDMSDKTIEQVLGEKTGHWLTIDRVVGVAIGMLDDKPCIRILVASEPEQVRRQIPENVEGYPVVIDVTGTLKARD